MLSPLFGGGGGGGRDAAYRVVCGLLGDVNVAVRLAACEGLLRRGDDVSFMAGGFEGYVAPAMEGLFGLLAVAREVRVDAQASRCLPAPAPAVDKRRG